MDRPLEIEELLSHAGWLRRLAGSLVRDEASADDLVQNTWVAAMRRPPRSGVRPWLARVMRNLVRNERRVGANRAAREALAQEEQTAPPPEEILQEAEAQRLLAESVANLAEPLRAVIVLHYFRGLDSRATARELGLSASAVRTRLQKALAELRAELDGRVEGGRRAWSLALGALVRGARIGTPAGAASVAGSAATMVAAPSMQALPWAGGVLLFVGAGLAAWMIADERETPSLGETHAADRVASSAPQAKTALERARGEPVAERAPIATHGREQATVREKSLNFSVAPLVEGRASEDELTLVVDGWEENLGRKGSEEEHHMVRSTREFFVSGAGPFSLGPLPPDWSGSLRVRDHLFENGQESMPLAGPSRELVLRLRSPPAIAGRLVDPLGHPVGSLGYERWVETSDGGSPVSGVTRRGSCDEEGRFRIPVARHGTSRAALLFDVPGRWRRLVTVPPFPGELGIDLGDVVLEPAAAQRFRLLDSFGGPLGSGGAVLVAPGDLGKVSPADIEGFGVLPSLGRSGAEVRFFAPRHEEKVMTLLPSELAEVQLERTSSLDVRFASTVAPIETLHVVLTAEHQIFARAAPDGGTPVVRTGTDWNVRKRSPPGGRDPVLELHYTIAPGQSLALNDLRPGVPFQIEVKDGEGHSLAVRSTYVVQGEWQDLVIPIQPGP